MNVSLPFIRRPVGTTLITIAVALAGMIGFTLLPVAPLPQVDFPTISVQASLPGASPDTIAATVATPLERSLTRIAGVTEMTSWSSAGSTSITLQFELDRNIDGAARDVQAAINAAATLLPSGLPSKPTYRKVNPADAPIMIIALTSATMTQGQMYDAASTVLAQKLSQVQGIGQVTIGGSALPAVRVQVNPTTLNKYGLAMEDVRAAITTANANRPKGALEEEDRYWQINANDQAKRAEDYLPIVISYRNGAPVRLSDVANVSDSVQDVRNFGSANGRPAVLLMLNRQPNANIIETVDRVRALLPQLAASVPSAIDVSVPMDRTPTIRASLREVERALIISCVLVILVVFLFLRNVRAALIPTVAVPVSLIGTFGVMYLCDYSLNTLSLMALTVATGFIVDDAVVVLENVSRHLEKGATALQAATQGAKEVGFTVLSMSVSLIAVFIPILLMGGIVGRLFREFAVTLSVAIVISLLVSLSTTPMMCAAILRGPAARAPNRFESASRRAFSALLIKYERSLDWALRHRRWMMLLTLLAVVLNVYLYTVIPKGLFPQQDTGRLSGSVSADQSVSFQAIKQKLEAFVDIVRQDPAVDNVIAFTGGGQRNSGRMFIALKPLSERKVSADQIIARMRGKLASVAGASLYLQPVQDIRIGGRASSAQFQYSLQSETLEELRAWEPRIRQAMSELPELTDVNTDSQNKGRRVSVTIDRDSAARLGVTTRAIDAALNNAFSQRQVSVIYDPLNQYRVVLEAGPDYTQSPQALDNFYVNATNGAQVPFGAIARYTETYSSLGVNHQGLSAATTISFNLSPGTSLSTATNAIAEALHRLGVPSSVQGGYQGAAKLFQASLANQPWLIVAALLTVYIILGILYESLIHPLTILSTLPSAGVGALLALMICDIEFSIVALIGVILLIGIVKKNAIMMIDFAIDAQRTRGLSPREAIYQAAILRLRPIMMTTMAAMLGAIPLAIGHGEGAEIRQPLGVSIVGGLIVSQLLTLYTTPVVYLYLERFRAWLQQWRARHRQASPLRPDAAAIG